MPYQHRRRWKAKRSCASHRLSPPLHRSEPHGYELGFLPCGVYSRPTASVTPWEVKWPYDQPSPLRPSGPATPMATTTRSLPCGVGVPAHELVSGH